jgi:hypothetical protein
MKTNHKSIVGLALLVVSLSAFCQGCLLDLIF